MEKLIKIAFQGKASTWGSHEAKRAPPKQTAVRAGGDPLISTKKQNFPFSVSADAQHCALAARAGGQRPLLSSAAPVSGPASPTPPHPPAAGGLGPAALRLEQTFKVATEHMRSARGLRSF